MREEATRSPSTNNVSISHKNYEKYSLLAAIDAAFLAGESSILTSEHYFLNE
jgi:hypothetical protein